MAITFSNRITGQHTITVFPTYGYIYEPMLMVMRESDLTATKMYIDLDLRFTALVSSTAETLVKYAEFDINPGQQINVDIMAIIRQHHDANVYKFGHVDDIVSGENWVATVTPRVYNFRVYSDKTAIGTADRMFLPVVGCGTFETFDSTVDIPSPHPMNEADLYGLTDYDDKFPGWPRVSTTLIDQGLNDLEPTITKVIPVTGEDFCEGYVIWKSRYGGWMRWGFNIETRTNSKSYVGNLEVGMYESTSEIWTTMGDPYVPVDYTGIETSYAISLKSLSRSALELKALSGIQDSPAVYYVHTQDGDLELMRLTAMSAPISTNINGGDFSITLSSISRLRQNTI